MLLCAKGTTLQRFVLRAAELFGLAVLDVTVAETRQTFANWLRTVVSALDGVTPCSSYWPCFVSPSLVPDQSMVPQRDRILVQASDQLLVLHLRAGGNLAGLLDERLQQGQKPTVFVALGADELVGASVAEPLMRRGAVGWLLLDAMQVAPPLFDGRQQGASAAIVSPPAGDSWNFLTHCTRRSGGSWPDQEEEEYLDELILGEPTRDRSSLASLVRIITTQRLLATGTTIRSGTKVVSFTEAKLSELSTMRTFRSHRSRWDFEPYGICIDKRVLESRGTRAVTYGDEELWSRLAETDRPFFQKTASAWEREIDWRIEREWRHLGDLDLSGIPASRALVFVPSRAEAEHVARVSRWPVTIVN